MSKSVTFIIDNGTVEIEATGFGGACDVATKAFEEVLGGQVSGKKRKAEYHKVAPVTLKQGAGK
jgi:Na+/H+-translocating membrane pyrophosphatase